MSALDGILRFPVPRQQFVESIDGVSVTHALENVGKISVRFDAVELAGFDERAHDRPAISTAVAAGEEMVLAAETDRADGALDRIGIEFDAAVGEEGRSADIMQLVREGQLDIAFVIGAPKTEDCHFRLLWSEPLMAVVPAEHPLTDRPTLGWANLTAEKLSLSVMAEPAHRRMIT